MTLNAVSILPVDAVFGIGSSVGALENDDEPNCKPTEAMEGGVEGDGEGEGEDNSSLEGEEARGSSGVMEGKSEVRREEREGGGKE